MNGCPFSGSCDYCFVICADLMLDSMVASGQLDPYYREKVQDILLTRHRHQHQRHQKRDGKGLPMIRSLADIGRKMSARNLSETKGIRSSNQFLSYRFCSRTFFCFRKRQVGM